MAGIDNYMLASRAFDNRRCFLGESPRWDPEAARLVWIDILAGRILTRSLQGGSRTSVTAGGRIGGIVLRADGLGYVVGQERSVRVVDPGGIVEKTLVERVPGDGPGLRTNELAVDAAGRVVFGTMTGDKEPGASALWRLEHDGQLRLLRDGLTISNGMGWIRDGSAMYHVDSPTRRVVLLPYGDGGCGDPEVVATIDDDRGVPDGLCVDADGGFWVAVNGAGHCRHYDPDGVETHRVTLPLAAVSSCVMVSGGEGSQLFMTTGASGLTEKELLDQPAAGFVFVADVPQAPADPVFYPG